ncbi:DUF6518 family protein [Pseudokineococcus sp. 1T1Z-3]|uniref:DUF6518 family protein n=1 Tax=Pseudokineococcus sp. 1T1Z-3 TaxID=3132745 RepID=UPI0030B284CB
MLIPALLAVGVGLVVGVPTFYAQGWLPEQIAPLANSSTSWCVVAALLALTARSAPVAALTFALALLSRNIGYGVGSELRGYLYGAAGLTFWSIAAIAAGPPIGAAAHWTAQGRRRLGPPVAGVLTGVIAGEGAYGLLVLAGNTPYGPYYGLQLALGVAGLAWAGARLRRPTAVAVAATTATAFVILYASPDLFTLLTGWTVRCPRTTVHHRPSEDRLVARSRQLGAGAAAPTQPSHMTTPTGDGEGHGRAEVASDLGVPDDLSGRSVPDRGVVRHTVP